MKEFECQKRSGWVFREMIFVFINVSFQLNFSSEVLFRLNFSRKNIFSDRVQNIALTWNYPPRWSMQYVHVTIRAQKYKNEERTKNE